jgi:hypothetical protein
MYKIHKYFQWFSLGFHSDILCCLAKLSHGNRIGSTQHQKLFLHTEGRERHANASWAGTQRTTQSIYEQDKKLNKMTFILQVKGKT